MVAHLASPATSAPAAVGLEQIEQLLAEGLAALPPDPGDTRSGPGRPRTLPSLPLWASLLVCFLHGLRSRCDLWRILSGAPIWDFPPYAISDQAVADRLQAAGTQRLEELFAHLQPLLAARIAPYVSTTLASFATEVFALDETVLEAIARLLPALRQLPADNYHLLAGKLAGLFDLRRQQWHRLLHVVDPRQSEQLQAWSMVQCLPKGSLILADLGYFCFEWFDDLTDLGYFWLSRLQSKISYLVIHTYYEQGTTLDCVVFLGVHRFNKAGHAVRLVQFEVNGQLYRYLTNVLDPQVFPLPEIARVYARRWDIELAVNLVKTHLKLHLLWSAKPILVLQQIWATLILAQILHAMQLEIAGRAGVDPFDVSLPLLVKYLPFFARTGRDPVAMLVEQGRELGLIRPSRRIRRSAPEIDPGDLVPLPPALVLERRPRYARRKGRCYHTSKEEAQRAGLSPPPLSTMLMVQG